METVARPLKTAKGYTLVEVELVTEDLQTGTRKLCTRGEFVMIALDADGHPTEVPRMPASAQDTPA